MARFFNVYGVFPRGYGKTFLEIMGMYHAAIFYPNSNHTMTAQTRENAAKLLEEKHREIIKFYPLIKDEIINPKFSKDNAEVPFVSGARIDIMANHQSSKGARRHRLNIEESALLNSLLFEDVLEPIVNIPRRTVGKLALIDPEELNGQINSFTTSGFKGSDEYYKNIKMVEEMANLKGKIVLGSDWQLACYYGRGETKSQILDKQAKLSPTFFAMNYQSRWSGSVESSLVNINRVMELRTLIKPELKGDGKSDYIIGVDVARSESSSNNQSSIAVGKIKRSKNGLVSTVSLVNLITMSNSLTFEAQAIEVKRFKNLFNAKAVIVDGNGLGRGLRDELLKEHIDNITNDSLKAYATINTDLYPDTRDYEKCVYDLTPQSANNDIIISFIDFVESGKLRILENKTLTDYDINDKANYIENILPFINQNKLIEEIANLQLQQLPSGKYTLKKVVKKIDKDRFSAVAYMLWYIKTFENTFAKEELDYSKLVMASARQRTQNVFGNGFSGFQRSNNGFGFRR